jgi:RNA polymerase sigma factor (sigma-70 family)
MTTDAELLRRYAHERSENAFTELVQRHIDLVYSAALREARGDASTAEDITQAVFVELARKASKLASHPSLAGWLYSCVRRMTANARRAEDRRQRREQEAQKMNDLLSSNSSESDWRQVQPLLDDAMHELSETDRAAVVLRFFEERSLKEVGLALRLNENAARMRVDRALEKLQALLAKRGITSTASGLAAAIAAGAVVSAPTGLAASVATGALTATAPITSSAFTALQLMSMTNLKAGIISAVVLASVVTPLVLQHQAQARLRDQNEALRQRADRLTNLQTENQRLSNLLAQASPRSLSNEQFSELLRLRGEVGRLRTAVREWAQLKPGAPRSRNAAIASMAKFYAERVSQLQQLLETNPSEKIPELQFLTDQDWLWLAHKGGLDTEEGHRMAMSLTRRMAEGHIFHEVLKPALAQYAMDNNGQFPADIAQLKPWFKSPVDDAILQRWVVLPKNRLASDLQAQLREDWFITQKAPVNAALDQRYLCGLNEAHLFADGPPHWWTFAR